MISSRQYAFAETALAEWANLIREFYAPRDQKLLMPSIREVYEPTPAVRTPRATNERPDPILSAIIADERCGRRLAKTVHNWLMGDNVGSFQMRRRGDLALLFWLEQEGESVDAIARAIRMRTALVEVALNLGKVDLALFLRVVYRRSFQPASRRTS